MDEPFEIVIKIIGVILLLIFCFGTPTVRWIIVGVIVLLVLLLFLILRIAEFKERRREKRAGEISQKYPEAFVKYKKEHRLKEKFDDWNISQWKELLSIKAEEWMRMQHEEEKRIALAESIKEQFLEIKRIAPKGLNYWIKKNNYYTYWSALGYDLDHIRDTTRDGRKIVTTKDVIENKELILQYEEAVQHAENFRVWNYSQEKFSSEFYQLSKGKLLSACGLTKHTIDFILPDIDVEAVSVDFVVHQYYFHRFCLDKSLDYTLFPVVRSNSDYIESGFDTSKIPVGIASDTCYYGLWAFFNSLFKTGAIANCSFVFCDDVETVKKDHFSKEYKVYKVRNAIAKMAGKFGFSCFHLCDVLNGNTPELCERIIIIGHVTFNLELHEQCRQILNSCKDSSPNIVYISIFKEFSSQEMLDSIERKKKILAEEEEKKRQEEERQLHEKEIINNIPTKVKDWESLWNGLKIKYLLDYYPTTVDFEADDTEWNNRWTVWYFKNDPEKTSKEAHKRVLERIIPQFVDLLKNTFEEETLKYLTLVCIPASTKEKNDARYKEFSERLCQETGIENAFPFVQVISEKMPKREGGEEGVVNYYFDDSFFSGKRVILLDDIITKGTSMRIARAQLEKLGAKVICGLSVGKTRHERRESSPSMDEN